MISGIVESVLMSVLPLYLLDSNEPVYGELSTSWAAGAACFTAVVFVVNLKVSG